MLLVLLAAAAVSLAPAQVRQVPEFRANARLIRLDVSVLDRSGRPVAGLLPGQFRVTEDGRPVDISYFEAVDALDELRSGAAPEPGDEPGPVSRRVLLLVDTAPMTVGQLIRARQSTARFLSEGTRDGDWVRLINLSTGRGWDGRMPEDRSRLEAAARRLARRTSIWEEGEVSGEISVRDPIEERVEAAVRGVTQTETSGRFLSVFADTSGLLGTLESLLVSLDGVLGRKALVLVSPGFPQVRGLDEQLERVASLARQAATSIYFVDAVGLDGLLPEPGGRLVPAFAAAWDRSGGTQDLAEATGGFASRFENSLLPALRRVAEEMRTHYVIGYVPPTPEDGRFRALKVAVSMPGIQVRTKKGYLAERASQLR